MRDVRVDPVARIARVEQRPRDPYELDLNRCRKKVRRARMAYRNGELSTGVFLSLAGERAHHGSGGHSVGQVR